MDRVAAMVLAGGRGGNFGLLSQHRTKAAFPVGGYYRIIDFPLSNLSNSGIRQVGVITQFMPASLMDHISSGRPWDFDMADRHLRFMTPFVGVRETRWFRGTGDAVAKNLNLISQQEFSEVLILSGEHVYRTDYRHLIQYHREMEADMTLGCVQIPPERQHPRFGNVVVGRDNRAELFIEKPTQPVSSEVCMGVFCFKRQVLEDLLAEVVSKLGEREYSLASDVIQPYIHQLNVPVWRFEDPWYYIGDLNEYHDFHMRLAQGGVALFDENWRVMTNLSDRNLGSRPPAYCSADSRIEASIISPGCRIEGEVINSVLSPGVRVGVGASVRNCVLFHDVHVGGGSELEHLIGDKDAEFGEGCKVGGRPPEDGAVPPLVIPKAYRVAAEETIELGAELDAPVLI